MREILFRGKKTGFNEWVQGLIVSPCEKTMCELKQTNPNVIWLVDAETVGQYTGLTDKKGQKIFEGDILFYEYGDLKKRGFVFYFDIGAKFGIKENDGHDNLSLLHDTQVKDWNIKVIGNIHDNPELLKGGAE